LASKQEALDAEKASLESESVALSKKEEEIVAKAEEAAKRKEQKVAKETEETKEKAATSSNNNKTTKPKNNNSSDKDKPKQQNGKLQAGDKLKVEATAYGPDCVGCSGFTATGMDVRPESNGGKVPKVIAVDPTVIPLGSVVKVPGYGTA